MSLQRRPSYSRNLNSETPGDSKNAFLRWGDVSDNFQTCLMCLASGMLVLHAGLFALCSDYVMICVSEFDMQCM